MNNKTTNLYSIFIGLSLLAGCEHGLKLNISMGIENGTANSSGKLLQ